MGLWEVDLVVDETHCFTIGRLVQICLISWSHYEMFFQMLAVGCDPIKGIIEVFQLEVRLLRTLMQERSQV